MKNKKNVTLVICFISAIFFLMILVCSILFSDENKEVNEETKEVVGVGNKDVQKKCKDALDKLMSVDKNYYITTTMTSNKQSESYIEINLKDGSSYTEIPVGTDGTTGNLDEIDGYVLYDWIVDKDNMYYVSQFTDSEDESSYIEKSEKLPKSFANYVYSRRYMYLDKVFDKLHSFEEYKTESMDFGEGEKSIELYKCVLPSESVKDILGVDTYHLYTSVKDDYSDNKNVVKLCDYYLDDLKSTLVFSDAKILLGINSSGELCYLEFEVGGLGSKLYMSKAMLTREDEELQIRETPNFDEAEDFVAVELQEEADYVSSFSSFEDALQAKMIDAQKNIENNVVSQTGSAISE